MPKGTNEHQNSIHKDKNDGTEHLGAEGFTTVVSGFKPATLKVPQDTIITSNSYDALCNEYDNEDKNEMDKDDDSYSTEVKSIDLLAPPKATVNIPHKQQNTASASSDKQGNVQKPTLQKPNPKQKTPMVLGTFTMNDKKLREHPRGYKYIENRLLQNKHHEVSLNNLMWYVTTSKPRFACMKTQLSQDCGMILAAAAQEYTGVCKAAWEDTMLELAHSCQNSATHFKSARDL